MKNKLRIAEIYTDTYYGKGYDTILQKKKQIIITAVFLLYFKIINSK